MSGQAESGDGLGARRDRPESMGAEGACLSHREVDQLVRQRLWGHSADPSLAHHAAECSSCASRIENAVEQERLFAGRVLPRTLPAVLAAEAERNRRWWTSRRFAWATGAVAAVSILVVAVVALDGWQDRGTGRRAEPVAATPQAEDDPYVGTKSAAALRVFLSRDGKARPLQDGKKLRPGDRLRVVPCGGGHRWLLLVYVDSKRSQQVVYPWEGSGSDAVPPEGEPLEGSLVLDDSIGKERLVGFFSDSRLKAADVLEFVAERCERLEGGPVEVNHLQAEVVVVELAKEAR